ncbi:MAG: ABC transporter ATP-binding protein/permease [Clostridiales bacterium]|nr:ABC transporter ATP-binding protein/permease [Clostridiales bacterium]
MLLSLFQIQREEHLNKIGEAVSNFTVICVFGLFEDQRKKYDSVSEKLRDKEDARKRMAGLVQAVSMGISELSFVLIIIFAMLLLIRGRLSVGYITSLSQLLGGVMYPFEMLPGYLLAYRTGRKLYRRNEREFEDEIERPEGKISFAEPLKEVRADHVFYGYRNGTPVLKDICMVLEYGKKYALIGDSGSGKSTLAKLLAGFLEADEGMVTVNGRRVQDVKEELLYQKIAYQEQNISVFQDSIRNNVLLGKACTEQCWGEIIHEACLEEVLEKLQNHEDTFLEEDGRNVSGGELQRIALERSLSTDPEFMIFDEIAASLDNQNAREIERNILRLADLGILMITHHLFAENMKLYDKIFVLRNGEIAEEGTWEELTWRHSEE